MNTEQLYEVENAEFYDEQAGSWNPLRAWFHTARNEKIRELVLERWKVGDPNVVDLGCGNALWNRDSSVAVTGVDISQKALEYTHEQGRIEEMVVASVTDTGLPDECASVVVCSEVIEHIHGFWKAMQEAHRILRPGGLFVTSVPYDTVLSMWRPLFALQCFYQGTLRGDEYYKAKCGHVNFFNPTLIAQYLSECGFKIEHQEHMKRFTIFTVGEKEAA